MWKLQLSVLFGLFGVVGLTGQVITTAVGTDWFSPISNQAARNTPLGRIYTVAVDSSGNLYFADFENHQVLRVTPAGAISVIAGNGFVGFSGDGGLAVNASLFRPEGLAVGSDGTIYIGDTGNNRVRKVTPQGVISTIAGSSSDVFGGDGGSGLLAGLLNPRGLAVDSTGNVFIADSGHSRIRKLSSAGVISTVAGTGTEAFSGDGGKATAAALNNPYAVALDSTNTLFIADSFNQRIRKVGSDGNISTVTGTGAATYQDGDAKTASFSYPKGLWFDAQNNLYISDPGNNLIRLLSGSVVSTIAGTGVFSFAGDGGAAKAAALGTPAAVAVDKAGRVFIADSANSRIRSIDPGSKAISTFAGNGQYRVSPSGIVATQAFLSNPNDLKIGPDGLLYIADMQNNRIARLERDGTLTNFAGSFQYGFSGDGGAAVRATMYFPRQIAFDRNGNLFVVESQNQRVRKINPAGIISTFAGNSDPGFSGDGGPATAAHFQYPTGVVVDSLGNVYVADQLNYVVRKILADGSKITTIAGIPGQPGYNGDNIPATQAKLSGPERLGIDAQDRLYIADVNNHRIRLIGGDGIIHTIAGTGEAGYSGDNGPATAAKLNRPTSVWVEPGSGNIVIADAFNNVVRVIQNGTIRTVAGNGVAASAGDGGAATSASLSQPLSAITDNNGGYYIGDQFGNRVRHVIAIAPTFQTTTASLTFAATAKGAVTDAQQVTLTSSLFGLPFSVTSSTPWLKVTTAAGTMPAAIGVTVDPAALDSGQYTATLTITAPQAAAPLARVIVTANISSAQPTVLSANKASVTFSLVQGGSSASQSLTVTSLGGASNPSASAQTASGGTWLSVTPSDLALNPGDNGSLTVVATPGNLPPGTYSGSVSVSGGNKITVPVTLSISAATRTILVSQTALSFSAVAQGGVPLPQSFGILNVGQGSMDWAATSTTLSGGTNWLQLSATSGSVPRPFLDTGIVSVSINPAGLAPADYYGQIRITASAANSPQIVTVILSVLPPGSDLGPDVRPTGLIFTGTAGQSPGSQDVLIGNPKAQSDSYISGGIGKGFTYLPPNATVQPDRPTTLRVNPDFSSLPPGSIERGTITLQFSDGTARNMSVLTIVAPQGTTANGTAADGGRTASGCASQILRLQPQSLRDNFAVTAGQAVTIQVQVADDCTNPLVPDPGRATVQVDASFSNGDKNVSLTHIGNGAWSGTWSPSKPSAGSVSVNLLANYVRPDGFRQTGAARQSGTIQTGSPTPQVNSGAVLNAASGAGAFISPGGYVAIYGSKLATATNTVDTAPLPGSLNGTIVTMQGKALPLRYVSDTQINALVPYDVVSNTQQQILVQKGSTLSIPQYVTVADAQPAVYTQDQSGSGAGSITNAANQLITPANPAHIGDTVIVYCNGLGAVNPPVAAGTAAPRSPLSRTANPLTATIGGVDARVDFAGLAPDFAGLYQVNVVVPAGTPLGDTVPIVLSTAGQTSPPTTLSVR